MGRAYEATRHNAGFALLDALINTYHLQEQGKKHHGMLWKGAIEGESLYALAPHTLMNRSGLAVGAAAQFYKIPPNQVIILHDDLDLAVGKLRIKQGGGHGGHNGLRDIDRVMGVNYWRVRLGIGRPASARAVSDYVLERFTADEDTIMQQLYARIALHFPLLLSGQADKLMSAVAQ